MLPGEVDLAGLEALASGVGEGMVIVVPTLSERQSGNPFVVAGTVSTLVGHGAPAVGGGVHKPGHVIHEHEAKGDAPEHHGPTADARAAANPKEEQAKGQLQQEEIVVEPAVVGITGEITAQARHCLHGWNRLKHPAHVAPPEAAMAVVVIRIRIRKLVVVAMQAHPVDRAVLAAQGPAGGEETFQPGGHLERAMREQAVIADGDPQAGGDPIEDQQGADGLGAPEPGHQCHDREGMDRDHESDRAPSHALIGLHAAVPFFGLV